MRIPQDLGEYDDRIISCMILYRLLCMGDDRFIKSWNGDLYMFTQGLNERSKYGKGHPDCPKEIDVVLYLNGMKAEHDGDYSPDHPDMVVKHMTLNRFTPENMSKEDLIFALRENQDWADKTRTMLPHIWDRTLDSHKETPNFAVWYS